jgi:valyl-tRNA synthetase
MSGERIAGYKHFVNKIWNATRFALMNLDDYASSGAHISKDDESLPDRWIKHRLNMTVSEVIKSLDEYRFNDAASGIYQFIWHELCDWYLELVKPELYGKGNPEKRRVAQHTLLTVMMSSLKLLHPIMPFVTEEIWQTLVGDGTSIMVSEFPSPQDTSHDPVADRQMRAIMDTITSIRNIRGEMNIGPSKKLKVAISAPDDESRAIVEIGSGYITNLANLETLTMTASGEEPKNAATGVVGSMRIYVLLEGVVDFAAERKRLEKEMAKVDKDLAVISKKLANRDFMAKASKAVVEKEEEKFREVREKHSVLVTAMKRFEKIN